MFFLAFLSFFILNLSGCAEPPFSVTLKVLNKFNSAPKDRPGLCTSGLYVKISSSNGNSFESSDIQDGNFEIKELVPVAAFGPLEVLTVEAWCKTSSTEGYSKYSRKGSSVKFFSIGVSAPEAGAQRPSYEVNFPGPIIAFGDSQVTP